MVVRGPVSPLDTPHNTSESKNNRWENLTRASQNMALHCCTRMPRGRAGSIFRYVLSGRSELSQRVSACEGRPPALYMMPNNVHHVQPGDDHQ